MRSEQEQDPLHEFLERHLYSSNSESEISSQLIHRVIQDYLLYLKAQDVHIPEPVKEIFIQDLKEELREMIIKKTFGALKVDQEKPLAGMTIRLPNRRPA